MDIKIKPNEDSQRELKIGSSFGKRYKVGRFLGNGGVASVYEMEDKRLQRKVAVKILHPQFRIQNFLDQFFKEAQSQASLEDCDHIVKIYDFDEAEYRDTTYYFISMELMKTDLKLKLKELKQYPLKKACQIGTEISEALIAANEIKLIHRDLKPGNIMLNNQERIKISDFGLAKIADNPFTDDSSLLKSPQYCAPERCLEGEKISHKTDIYSFGCILYEILTGYTLFHGENPQIQMYAHLDKEPPRLSDMLADIPLELDDLVIKMVDKKQENRPDAKQVKETLTLVLNKLSNNLITVNFENKFKNSIGMEFVYIPPGTFQMGSPDFESGRNSNETQHWVRLTKGFYMQTTTVTKGQWFEVMKTRPWHGQVGSIDDNDSPAEYILWDYSQDFIKVINQLEATDKYRLPTEAEWEYACRANNPDRYSFGNDESKLKDYAWYGSNGGSYAKPVAQLNPNAFGLYDMHGNIWEWCKDIYANDAYTKHTYINPENDTGGSYRVLRGGSWNNDPVALRSADRYYDHPAYRYSLIGFRLLRTF